MSCRFWNKNPYVPHTKLILLLLHIQDIIKIPMVLQFLLKALFLSTFLKVKCNRTHLWFAFNFENMDRVILVEQYNAVN